MDKVSKEKRSEIMSKVRSVDSKAELLVRSKLHKCGYRFRLHDKNLPGKPDIVLKKHRIAVFVHGCFWHSHNCRAGKNKPHSNLKYWRPKLERNKFRDQLNILRLQLQGWKVLVIWECQAKEATIEKWIQKELKPLE